MRNEQNNEKRKMEMEFASRKNEEDLKQLQEYFKMYTTQCQTNGTRFHLKSLLNVCDDHFNSVVSNSNEINICITSWAPLEDLLMEQWQSSMNKFNDSVEEFHNNLMDCQQHQDETHEKLIRLLEDFQRTLSGLPSLAEHNYNLTRKRDVDIYTSNPCEEHGNVQKGCYGYC
ncbi:unnamed protein product [Caenorhabditis sp. 36 PRJEB53466]|nr:unnamed protein product [Caenorhabditis sp. 36 PRJEB53466]